MNSPLRTYQEEMLDAFSSHTRNQIIVLPTGTGKTRVAFEAMLEAYRMYPHRHIIFVTHTIALGMQQCEYFKEFLRNGGNTHGLNPNAASYLKKSAYTPIMFAVADRACTFLERPTRRKRTSLVVIDECHHAVLRRSSNNRSDVSGHPFSRLVSLLHEAAPLTPRIMGLTASPGADRAEVVDLGQALQAYVRCPSPTQVVELKEYLHVACLVVTCPDKNSADEKWRVCVNRLSNMRHSVQRENNAYLHAFMIQLCQLVFCCGYDEKFWLSLCASRGKKMSYSFDSVLPHRRLLHIQQILEENLGSNYLSPTLTRCIRILRDTLCHTSPDKKAIIFAETVFLANTLHLCLEGYEWIRPVVLTGNNDSSQKQMKESIKAFRKDGNVLIATSIAEEGLDIPSVSCVILFNPPQTIIKFIQTRGRARFPNSEYHVFTMNESEKQIVESQCEYSFRVLEEEFRPASRDLRLYYRDIPPRNNWSTDADQEEQDDDDEEEEEEEEGGFDENDTSYVSQWNRYCQRRKFRLSYIDLENANSHPITFNASIKTPYKHYQNFRYFPNKKKSQRYACFVALCAVGEL